jgi:hypothetical protein
MSDGTGGMAKTNLEGPFKIPISERSGIREQIRHRGWRFRLSLFRALHSPPDRTSRHVDARAHQAERA